MDDNELLFRLQRLVNPEAPPVEVGLVAPSDEDQVLRELKEAYDDEVEHMEKGGYDYGGNGGWTEIMSRVGRKL